MSFDYNIVEITPDNLTDHPQVICFINPKHESYHHKIDWIKQQYKNGLKIKLLYLKDVKRPVGFIEYIPGEYCWRSVDAKGYMFIHCLYINGKKYQHQGLGTLLIKAAEKDAKDMLGIAVVTSENAFMVNKTIFIKNGYTIADESGKEQLWVKSFKQGSPPRINHQSTDFNAYQGLTMIYSRQCPWVARFIDEVHPILEQENITAKIIELETHEEAQNAPSLYSGFNLIYNGKLLADRYISTTRFKNILKKEI